MSYASLTSQETLRRLLTLSKDDPAFYAQLEQGTMPSDIRKIDSDESFLPEKTTTASKSKGKKNEETFPESDLEDESDVEDDCAASVDDVFGLLTRGKAAAGDAIIDPQSGGVVSRAPAEDLDPTIEDDEDDAPLQAALDKQPLVQSMSGRTIKVNRKLYDANWYRH